jgi:DNA primase
MRERSVPFRRAVELLRAQAGLAPVVDEPREVPAAAASRVIAPLAASADDAALLDEVIGFYHATLKQNAEGLAYLSKRGLTHPEVIDHFRLGYANRTLAYRLPEKQVKSGAAVRGQLQRLGLLRSSGHEHFAGSLVVPLTDAAGAVVGVYGRKTGEKFRDGTPLHLYLPGPHRGVFNLDGWRGSEEVILCEALIDALTFWCAGYHNVTAAYGINGFTDEILQAFTVYGVRRVLIAYDRDEAGDSAADALAPKLAAHGIDSCRVLFPKGLDANAYALKVGPPEKSLGLVLKQTQPIGKAKARVEAPAQPAATLDPVPSLAAAVAAPVEAAPIAVTPIEPRAPAPIASLAAEVSEQQVVIALGDRRYRVRGLAKNLSADTLRVNLLASNEHGLHVDTFDLYAAKARAVFVKQAASALNVEESALERDLARLLLKLEELQEAAIKAALAC